MSAKVINLVTCGLLACLYGRLPFLREKVKVLFRDKQANDFAFVIPQKFKFGFHGLSLPVLLLFSITAAQAAIPVITAPAITTAAQSTAKTIAGISIAESGAAPTLSYTVTLTVGAGTLTATGSATITGSGTKTLTIVGTVAVVNPSLATLAFTGAVGDQITIAAHDANAQNAVSVVVPVNVLPTANTYLLFATLTLAQTRSQSQCTTLGCDGTKTKYWWNIIGPTNAGTIGATAVTANSYAVEIQGSGAFGMTTKVGPCAVGCGLSTAEQGQLVTAAQVASVMP